MGIVVKEMDFPLGFIPWAVKYRVVDIGALWWSVYSFYSLSTRTQSPICCGIDWPSFQGPGTFTGSTVEGFKVWWAEGKGCLLLGQPQGNLGKSIPS